MVERKGSFIIAILIVGAVALTSCGGANWSSENYAPTPAPYDASAPQAVNTFEEEHVSGGGEYYGEAGVNTSRLELSKAEYAMADFESDDSAPTGFTELEQKIIKMADISAETKDMDGFTGAIQGIVEAYDGYIEHSNVRVIDYDKTMRAANYVLRVPSESYQALKQEVCAIVTVVSQSESADNATGEYYDLEARITIKKAEEERLLAMIDKADEVEELILLEERLSNVRTDIELYETRRLNIDRLASYSTIRVHVSEVLEETIRPVSGDDLGSRMRGAFNGSVNALVSLLELIVVAFSGLLLPLIIIGIPVVVIIAVYRVRRKQTRVNTEIKTPPDNNNTDGV